MSEISMIPVAIATAIALYISVIDLREFRIPNRILIPGLALTTASMFAVAVVTDRIGDLFRAFAGALLATAIFFTIHLLNPAGLGMGDVKFATLIGLTLAWISFPIGLLGLAVSWLAAAIFAIAVLLVRGSNRHQLVPFGPFMFFGLLFVEFGLLL